MSTKPKKPPVDKKSIRARLARKTANCWFIPADGSRKPTASRARGGRRRHVGRAPGVFRLGDVQTVSTAPDPDCLEINALKARQQWPPTAPDLDLDKVLGAIGSALPAML